MQVAPRRRRMDVDLDDAGIGRDAQHLDARIARRRIAFDGHRRGQRARGVLDRGEQRHVGFELLARRHEHVQVPVAHLQRQRRLDRPRAACCRAPWRPCAANCVARRQRFARRERIDGEFRLRLLRQHFRQRSQRQPQAERRIAGQRVQVLALQRPRTRFPADRPAGSSTVAFSGSTNAGRRTQSGASAGARAARARRACARSACSGSTFARQRRFRLQQLRHVLVGGDQQRGRQAERRREALAEHLRRRDRRRARLWSCRRSACRPATAATPSVRQNTPSAQRGSGSPGYHLPCP